MAVDIYRPVREAVSYRGLFTIDWFGVREKHYFQLKIYERLRASKQANILLLESTSKQQCKTRGTLYVG